MGVEETGGEWEVQTMEGCREIDSMSEKRGVRWRRGTMGGDSEQHTSERKKGGAHPEWLCSPNIQ